MYRKLMLFESLNAVLNGVSQIMLQENRITALLFVFGLLAGSWQCAVAVVAGSAVGMLTARLLKYNKGEILSGLYGFSPALVGAALAFLYEYTFVLWIFIVVGSISAAIVQHLFIIRNIPAFTFPFILVTWLLVLVINSFVGLEASVSIGASPDYHGMDLLLAVSNGFGEVIFQGAALSGILFMIGVLWANPIAGVFAVAASWVGGMVAISVGQPADMVSMGLYGFNTVLTAIVFAGSYKGDAVWTLIGVTVTIAIHIILVNTQVLNIFGGVFTFPFVAGTWITLWMRRKIVL